MPNLSEWWNMVRTQIRLTERQTALLRALAAERRQTVAELARLCIDSFLHEEAGNSIESKRVRAKRAVGRYSSGHSDVSAEHDRYLAEAFLKRGPKTLSR